MIQLIKKNPLNFFPTWLSASPCGLQEQCKYVVIGPLPHLGLLPTSIADQGLSDGIWGLVPELYGHLFLNILHFTPLLQRRYTMVEIVADKEALPEV